jgi:hypothetical protein
MRCRVTWISRKASITLRSRWNTPLWTEICFNGVCDFRLTLTQAQGVPEPGSVALLLPATELTALVWQRHRSVPQAASPASS